MCGIAGAIDYSLRWNGKECYIKKVKNILRRRGPDQNGIYYSDEAVLIHSRLCIVDAENGKQPMEVIYGNKKYCIVYNGELYNTLEIRNELKSKGHKFIGYSDTEVIIRSYVQWGEGCLDKFNGIFAFAIWDKNRKELFIARDRLGVKPLFFCEINGMFIFGSEIKAILAHPIVKPRIDSDGIIELMLLGPGRTPGCGIFKDIRELKAGQFAKYNKNGLHINEYWNLKDREHTDDFNTTVEKVRYLVTDSIKRQMISDVPICTFLSGGLDSSIITSVIAKEKFLNGEKLTSYSVCYKDNDKYFKPGGKFQPDSDDEYINIMKDYLNISHNKVMLDSEDLAQALFMATQARDLPGMADVDSSLLLFCKEVKKNHTVAISGECADELFGGYPWFRDKETRVNNGFPWAQNNEYRKSFIKNGIIPVNRIDEYIRGKYNDSIKNTSKEYCKDKLEIKMREITKLNIEWFMQTLLDRKDRMSMFNGLEVRVPFCDYRIVEYMYSVPWKFKNYKNREKGLIRYAMRDILPAKIVERKKSPYPKTWNPSYFNIVKNMLKNIIDNPSSPVLEFVRKDALEGLLNSNMSNPWYGQLMTTPQTIAYFVQMNYWLDVYNIDIVQ